MNLVELVQGQLSADVMGKLAGMLGDQLRHHPDSGDRGSPNAAGSTWQCGIDPRRCESAGVDVGQSRHQRAGERNAGPG
jgi:hypothetical protein